MFIPYFRWRVCCTIWRQWRWYSGGCAGNICQGGWCQGMFACPGPSRKIQICRPWVISNSCARLQIVPVNWPTSISFGTFRRETLRLIGSDDCRSLFPGWSRMRINRVQPFLPECGRHLETDWCVVNCDFDCERCLLKRKNLLKQLEAKQKKTETDSKLQ